MSVEKKRNIYVVGFPKSGNTWLSRMLSSILDSPIEGGDNYIDRVDQDRDFKGCCIVKKIHSFKTISDVEAVNPADIVYIVRDIRDVLVSGFFFNNRSLISRGYCNETDFTEDSKRFRSFFCRFYFNLHLKKLNRRWQGNILKTIRQNRKFRRGEIEKRLPVGNWSKHVRYWTEKPGVTVVKYESLLSDTLGEMIRVVNALGFDCGAEKISPAVEAESFQNRKRGFEAQGDKHNAAFLRQGTAGDYRRFVSGKLERHICYSHEAMLKRFGYPL